MHLPARLRRYSIFDASPLYVDSAATAQAISHTAQAAYLPLLRLLIAAAKRSDFGPFRVGLSITGVTLELLERHSPEVSQLLHALYATGCCEFLGETFHGSLASLYSRTEFAEQVALQTQILKRSFGRLPTVFRNTELLFSNDIARALPELGFTGALAEGVDSVLASRSPSFIYSAAGTPGVRLLLRHRTLSDAIGRTFGDPAGPFYPLTEEKFAATLSDIGGQICNLFFDAESFGLWQPASTGVFDFITALPARLAKLNCQLVTPTEALGKFPCAGDLDMPQLTSWSSPGRDTSPWLANAMQKNAQQDLYNLEQSIKAQKDRLLTSDFRTLTAADHAWFMSTRTVAEERNRRPSPYESPYDAYINFMNILENLKARAKA
jgi:alpha-amylase